MGWGGVGWGGVGRAGYGCEHVVIVCWVIKTRLSLLLSKLNL